MDIRKLSFVNLFSLNNSIKLRIIAFNAASRNGKYKVFSQEKTQQQKQNLIQISILEKEINELRSFLKKEIQFNKKLEFNISIKNKEKSIQILESQL